MRLVVVLLLVAVVVVVLAGCDVLWPIHPITE
jgi:hypothetical protein